MSQYRLSRRELIAAGGVSLAAEIASKAFWIEPNQIELVRVEVPIPNLPKAFDGFRIGQISDIHWEESITRDYLDRAYRLLAAQKPDMIAVTGDFVDGYPGGTVPDHLDLFSDYQAPFGVYGVLGNHDHWADAEWVTRQLADSPVQLLVNQNVVIEKEGQGLALVGIDDIRIGMPHEVAAFRGVDPAMPCVMLAHNPDFAEERNTDHRIDVQISGHTHGGHVSSPWGWAPITSSQYGGKYRCGLVKGPNHPVFVSKGLARSKIHIRLFAVPDVSVIVLRRAEG